jgi:hypothetical protein
MCLDGEECPDELVSLIYGSRNGQLRDDSLWLGTLFLRLCYIIAVYECFMSVFMVSCNEGEALG